MKELLVIAAASLPYLELRGAIPLAWQLGLTPLEAYVLSVFGNMVPVVPIMLLIDPISRWLRRFRFFDRFFEGLFARCRKYQKEIIKYGYWGLATFVAIPLPMTGAWSGAVIAFLMGLRKRHALIAIAAGVAVAGLIVLTATYGLSWLLVGGG
ncbi:MAG TPA: small multi-drug export protein [Bacillota bacterium]|nr:small multi-drug export protein [Bacillota bacterium]HPT87389.1 small multi-drug export protein [Bacillota bacterium]